MSLSRRCTLSIYSIPVLFLLSACSNDDSAQVSSREVLRPVKTVVVSAGNNFIGREFPGVVDAIQTAELGFQVSGRLQQFDVMEGQQVSEGQLIAQLDQTDFKLKVESSQVEYDRTEADYKRGEQLVKDGNISKSDFDKLKASYASANTQLKAAKQELEYTSLKAPFAGLIAERHVDNFVIVQAKQAIVTLQDISSLAIRIDMPESVMINLDPDNDNRRIFAVFEALGDTRFPLAVKEVATRADPQSQTFRVTLTMPAPRDHIILPGMTVTVIGGPVDASMATVTLPPQAVMEDSAGRYVFVAVPGPGEAAVIARREVTTGRLLELGLEVLTGLTDGDRVVTAGMSKIQAGMQVRLLEDVD